MGARAMKKDHVERVRSRLGLDDPEHVRQMLTAERKPSARIRIQAKVTCSADELVKLAMNEADELLQHELRLFWVRFRKGHRPYWTDAEVEMQGHSGPWSVVGFGNRSFIPGSSWRAVRGHAVCPWCREHLEPLGVLA